MGIRGVLLPSRGGMEPQMAAKDRNGFVGRRLTQMNANTSWLQGIPREMKLPKTLVLNYSRDQPWRTEFICVHLR
jgi:hypothetical protein